MLRWVFVSLGFGTRKAVADVDDLKLLVLDNMIVGSWDLSLDMAQSEHRIRYINCALPISL